MSATAGPNIAEDNIIFYIDAANPRSFVQGSSTIYDLSYVANSGSLVNGVGSGSGNVGHIKFDGVDDYIIPNYNYKDLDGALLRTKDFTVSMWFRTTANGRAMFQVDDNTTIPNNASADKHLYINTSGHLVFGVYNGGQLSISSSVIYNDGNWHHACATHQIGVGCKLYADGRLQASMAQTCQDGSNDYLRFGNSAMGSAWPLSIPGNGYLQNDMGLCTLQLKILSPQEVLQNFNAQRSRFGI